MKKRSHYFFFLFFISAHLASAQLQKGDWLAGGELHFNIEELGSESGSSTTFSSKKTLGIALSEQWLVGGRLGFGFSNNRVELLNALFGRYYFLDENQVNFFAGLEAQLVVEAYKNNFNQFNRRFRHFLVLLSGGVDFWLSSDVAIEAVLDYNPFVLSSISPSNPPRIEAGPLQFQLALIYLIKPGSQDDPEWNQEQTRQWFSGRNRGNSMVYINLSPDLRAGQTFNRRFEVLLSRGRFLWKQLQAGGTLSFTGDSRDFRTFSIAAGPYVRQYFPVLYKGALFTHGGLRYQFTKSNGFFVSNGIVDLGLGSSKIICSPP